MATGCYCCTGVAGETERKWDVVWVGRRSLESVSQEITFELNLCVCVCVCVWLKTTYMYSFTALEAGSLKWRYQLGHIPSRGSRAEFFLDSSRFWWLQTFFHLRPPQCSLYLDFPQSLFCVSHLNKRWLKMYIYGIKSRMFCMFW